MIFQYYSVRRMAADCLAMYEQVRRRKYQVVMSGYYGFSNAGDDAILEAIHQSILEASGEVGGHRAVQRPPRDPAALRHECHPPLPFLEGVRCPAPMRRSAVRRGSLLQDRTSTRSLLYYLSIVRCAEWMGKPVMLYANGIGPVQKPANRRRVKRAVERAALVTLRDHSSARELVEMGVERPDLHVTADPVFNLDPPPRSGPGNCSGPPGWSRALPSRRSRCGTGRIRAASPGSWPPCATISTGPAGWRSCS